MSPLENQAESKNAKERMHSEEKEKIKNVILG
jgi:hypothetical protein